MNSPNQKREKTYLNDQQRLFDSEHEERMGLVPGQDSEGYLPDQAHFYSPTPVGQNKKEHAKSKAKLTSSILWGLIALVMLIVVFYLLSK